MNKKAPGKGFLKVVGILLIIGGVFGFIGAFMNYAMIPLLNSPGEALSAEVVATYEELGITAQTLQTAVIISVIQGVLYLAAGIMGVVNCNKIEKANICFVFGILLIAYVLIQAGNAAVTGGFNGLSVISILFSLILPLLYFWGALKNRQAMQDTKSGTDL